MNLCRTALLGVSVLAGRPALAGDDFEREPIRYTQATPSNRVSRLIELLKDEKKSLKFEEGLGYAQSLLKALDVPTSSQMLVFSKTSLQRQHIGPATPRAIYFNDDVYVGFCQGGPVIEVTAVDAKLGAVFYTLEQHPEKATLTRRGDDCMLCHGSSQTHNIPGHLVRSVYADRKGYPILSGGSFRVDHTTPLKSRWGGWYVTGTHGDQKHLGNLLIRTREVPEDVVNPNGLNVTSLKSRFDVDLYPAPSSDVVALMVLEHQTEGHNLITQANFTTRQAVYDEAALNRELKEPAGKRWESTAARIRSAGEPLVKYLLFCEEAPLTAPIQGTSTFAREFAGRGPRDAKGRSLRDLDLKKRMFRYPCSYLVHSEAFRALPQPAREYVWRRMWGVLSAKEPGDFPHLSRDDRTAIREILLATVPDLPEYWRR